MNVPSVFPVRSVSKDSHFIYSGGVILEGSPGGLNFFEASNDMVFRMIARRGYNGR
jgi:hypothetical protein